VLAVPAVLAWVAVLEVAVLAWVAVVLAVVSVVQEPTVEAVAPARVAWIRAIADMEIPIE
jgi:hypothetical protein